MIKFFFLKPPYCLNLQAYKYSKPKLKCNAQFHQIEMKKIINVG